MGKPQLAPRLRSVQHEVARQNTQSIQHAHTDKQKTTHRALNHKKSEHKGIKKKHKRTQMRQNNRHRKSTEFSKPRTGQVFALQRLPCTCGLGGRLGHGRAFAPRCNLDPSRTPSVHWEKWALLFGRWLCITENAPSNSKKDLLGKEGTAVWLDSKEGKPHPKGRQIGTGGLGLLTF